MSNEQLDPSVEVVHLQRLLYIQPGCLMRLGGDGVVLAANEAALTLLGMQSGQQALGRDFAGWIPPDQRDRWQAFTVQVIGGSPASLECDIINASGHQQATLLHGVPLTDHPDGVPSMAVAARVVSGRRQLEVAVVEREEILRELEGTIHALQTRHQTDLEARDRELDESAAACAVAEAACRQALADRQQGQAALEELSERHQQLTTERAAERQRVLERLEAMAVQHRQDLVAAQNAPERNRLLATIEERDATVRQLETAHAAAQADLDAVVDDRLRLEASMREAEARHQARERETEHRLAVLHQSEQDARQQRDELQGRLDQIRVAHRDLAAEHAATADERDRLFRNLAEQAVRSGALAAHGRQLMPLAFAGRAARDVASQLRQHLERVDDLATGMLVTGVVDSAMRPALEQLRGEAAQASALADEILTGVDGQPITESADCPVVSGDERRSR